MALAMARPWKHPKTGIYWLRKAVPEDLRALVGKREEKRTLGTRDPAEAKRRHAKALLEIEARWVRMRAGLAADGSPVDDPPIRTTLTELEAHERAAWMYRFWLDKHRNNPSQQTFWRTDLYDQLWRPMPLIWGDGDEGLRRFATKWR